MGIIGLRGATIFDSTGREPRRGDLWLRDDLIAEPPGGPADEVLDLDGHTVLPGFIDAHAHVGLLSLYGQASWSAAEQAGYVFRNLRESLDQGFTTLRDLGGIDGGVTQAIKAGLVEGPRMHPSGQILSQIGGHGDMRPTSSDEPANPDFGCGGLVRNHALCTGPDQVRAAVRQQFRRGAKQIKMFVTGGVLSEGDPLESPQFTVEEIRAAHDEARSHGSYVTAHAHTVTGLMRALEAGVRSFEHVSVIDDETASALKRSGAIVVPTLAVVESLTADPAAWGVPGHLLDDLDNLHTQQRRSLAMLDDLGVPLGSGADLIGIEQRTRARQIYLMAAEIGLAGAIESATRVNAELLRIADKVGTIEPGKVADLVVYEGDAAEDPEVIGTRPPKYVLQSGRIVRSP
ncbi:metal-dependent hydrolase family protein [Nonomuraea diastatica]|uniref:Amidohydrolase family protein n=1 Tax=Nonomuraea diastatica TaxID=1848329 RepID=A0A4R4WHS3_9ACTN|nr:amidohydrolase family protein [Nonomuraea diastatica]TDD18728.1 amidohydrolase family protein [Nonomuraea diastatica]